MSEDLLAGVERVLRERGGREIVTTDGGGSPLRIFYDGPTVVVENKGNFRPFEGLNLEDQQQVYHESGAELSAPSPKSKVVTPQDTGEPAAEGEVDPIFDPQKNPMLKGMFD